MSNTDQKAPATNSSAAATSVTFTDFDDFRLYVDKFSGEIRRQDIEHREAVEALRVQKRVATYINLGEALRISTVLSAPGNRLFLVRLLTDRGIAWAKDEQNQFLPLCKLLFGHFDNKGNFVVDPTANAYAPVLRYLDEHNVQPAEVPQFIEAYVGEHGNKLDGIRKQDQQDHGTGPDLKAEQLALDLLLSEPPTAEVAVDTDSMFGMPSKGKLTAMWGEWNEGRFIPRGFIGSSEEQVEKIARKQAIANEGELRRRELARKEAKIAELEGLLKAKTSS